MTASGSSLDEVLDEVRDWTWDAIILGAGPAGAIAARELALRGASTLLVDRKPFPRPKVCGACLNLSALDSLEASGLGGLVPELGGVPLRAVEVKLDGRSLRMGLPGGFSLSRARLDAALAEAAAAAGAWFLHGVEGIVGPVQDGARGVILTAEGRRLEARARVVIVATGLGSPRFEGQAEVVSTPAPESRIGAGCQLPSGSEIVPAGTVVMAVGRHGYVGLTRVEDQGLNVAAAFQKAWIKAAGSPGAAAARILREAGVAPPPELEEAIWQGTAALTRKTRPLAADRLFVLGDAAGYVEPFTGEGMAWALRSGLDVAPLAARAADRWDPALVQEWRLIHGHGVARRQRLCRIVALLLRHPRLARSTFQVASRLPSASHALIRLVNHPLSHRQPS